MDYYKKKLIKIERNHRLLFEYLEIRKILFLEKIIKYL